MLEQVFYNSVGPEHNYDPGRKIPFYCGMTHQSKARMRLPISRSL